LAPKIVFPAAGSTFLSSLYPEYQHWRRLFPETPGPADMAHYGMLLSLSYTLKMGDVQYE
jgi:hypothetical protein